MEKFYLPITYKVSGVVEVEAETIEDAVEYFHIHLDEISLPYETEFVDGSMVLDSDMEHVNLINESERARRG